MADPLCPTCLGYDRPIGDPCRSCLGVGRIPRWVDELRKEIRAGRSVEFSPELLARSKTRGDR